MARVPKRVYIVAGVSAVIVGIAVNALTLQRGRHPAPLFAPAHEPTRPAPAAVPPPAHPHAAAAVPASPPPAPVSATPEKVAPLASVSPRESAAPASHADPIAELLRGEAPSEEPHLVLAAQNALIKLGYSLKADGHAGAATQQALREFERSHKIPPSTEITPRLVKQLNAAAQSSGR
ncbi:MAG TPA: peptidoglycan-binding domain-containing protein [Roseiarcus sp.]|nr:peptidoglycan-binding domain-containing protein [Roseiarcus sp.]